MATRSQLDLKYVRRAGKNFSHFNIRATTKYLDLLAESTDNVVSDQATAIRQMITLRNTITEPNDIVNIAEKINGLKDMLLGLSDSNHFFLSLDNTESFKGTLHCEACLASLLPPSFAQYILSGESKYKEMSILPKMQVGYPLPHLSLSSGSHFIFL